MKNPKKYARTVSAALCSLMILTSAPALADSTYATVQGGGLNLRQTASTQAKVLGQYPTGTWINILEKGDTWSRVSVNGKTGYMMSKFLAPVSSSTMYVSTNTGVGLNLRTGPSMDSAIITSFQPGTAVTVLKRGRGWHYVSVGGEKGYMGSQYLVSRKKNEDVGKPHTGSFQAKLVNPNGGRIVNFRQGAGLNARIICAYPVGTLVTVLEEGSSWCKVEINGQKGYVSAYFLKR